MSRLRSRLVGGPTGDPAVFVDIEGSRRSLLLDCGDLGPLSAAEILRVSDCFISHAHLDHFYGFDRLLRLSVGSLRTIRVFGPEGILDRVGGKLNGYHWNLCDELGLAFEVTEVVPDRFRVQTFQIRERFLPASEPQLLPPRARLVEDEDVAVEWTILDHGIPCLAYLVVEPDSYNVDPGRLAAAGYSPGPWLRELKRLAASGADPSAVVATPAGDRSLSDLSDRFVTRRPGLRVAYVTDTLYSPETRESMEELARGADLLYCEHYYLEEDRELADRNRHLTARQAGLLARGAGVGELVPFHHSPKYSGRYEDLVAEGAAAFQGGDSA